MTDNYVFATGTAALPRLSLIDKFYGDSSLNFLKKIGLNQCKKIADIGCGTGQLACRIASEIKSDSMVIGIDQNEDQLKIARSLAQKQNLKNIEFIRADIYDCEQFADSFDLIHTRSLLIHLQDPILAIQMMYKMLRKKGILSCEEYNLSTCFSYPENPAINKVITLFSKLSLKYNLDPEIGIKLFNVFKEIGLKSVDTSFYQLVGTNLDSKALIEMGLMERKPKLISNNLISEIEFEKLISDIQRFILDEKSIIGYWRFSQTFGIKSNE